MEKVIKPCKPKQKKYIFTEGINYFKTGKKSIWGVGDKDTLKILNKITFKGKWLNLAAGDGRYNLNLLKKADFVIASDVDGGALSKLWYNTPERYRKRLGIKVFDITKKFPFKDKTFDGVFCTGTLHIFSLKILGKIIREINRILKRNGRVILDFATDIKRIRLDSKKYIIKDEPKYTINKTKKLLRTFFKDYNLKMYNSYVPEEILKKANPPYKFSSKFILLIADKKLT